MESSERELPELMQNLHRIPIDYKDDIEFEPYESFRSVEYTQDWFRAWTGNDNADATNFLIFGQDGTGGHAAIWLVRDNENLLEQPIVFFGSEGELGVVARNFSDYLWLLVDGCGPHEAVAYADAKKKHNAKFAHFAAQHATTPRREPIDIIAAAQSEFHHFKEWVNSMCR